MAYSRSSIPDLSGRTAVVTGANGGLGLETARALAAKRAHVVMAVRDQAKAERAVADITASALYASLELVPLDLASLDSARAAAVAIRERHDQIDILVNNAGVMATPQWQTADGFELQLGVNHLGHWALTALLLPSLLAAPAARVVTVTSIAHHLGRGIDPDNPHLHSRYSAWGAYGQAKLANYHFGLGLQERFARAHVRAASLVAHPGLTNSELQTTTVGHGGAGWNGPIWAWLAAHTGMNVAQGALPQIRAATDPHARGGEFYGPRFGSWGPPVRLPLLRPGRERAIANLWAVSERETGIPLEIR